MKSPRAVHTDHRMITANLDVGIRSEPLEERRSWDGGVVDVNVESRPRTVQNGQRKQGSMADLS